MKYLYQKKGKETSGSDTPEKVLEPIYYLDESSSGDIIWRPPTSSGGDDSLDRCVIINPVVDTTVDPQTGLKKKPKPKPQLPETPS